MMFGWGRFVPACLTASFFCLDCVMQYAFVKKKAGDVVKYTPEEVMQFVQEEDIKFIRLAFCDVYGKQHNVAIMPSELKRAFEFGIAIDASAIDGFGGEVRSDLLLHPDASTLIQLPWRPEQGKLVRMFSPLSSGAISI